MLEDVVRMDLDLHNLRQMRTEQRALQLQLERAAHRRDDQAPSDDKEKDRRQQDDSNAPRPKTPSSDGRVHVIDMILE